MARKLLKLTTEDGGTILVAVEVPEGAVTRITKSGELPIEKVDQKFDDLKEVILRSCRPLTKAFQVLHQQGQAASAEVEFGLNFTAKGNIYLVESASEAALKVKVNWNLQASNQASNEQ